MFKHGQQSLLTVREGERALGSISLRPSVTGSDSRLFDFSGALSVDSPLAARQRFNFNGAVDMDATLRVLAFHAELSMQDPHCRLDLKGDTARKTLSYEARRGEMLTAAQTLPMDPAALAPALMRNLGLDPAAIPISPGNISPPDIGARETQISLHGEQLEVYEISVREGTAMSIDFYVTQLGQIVLANTNFGYTLSAEDYQ
jgi:hypothetical protein